MTNDDLDDFFLKGGDEMMNSETCAKCGGVIYFKLGGVSGYFYRSIK